MELNVRQMKNVFAFIDSYKDEKAKKDIFEALGHECFVGAREWANSIGRGNIEKVIDDVNNKNKSPYWEELRYDGTRSALYLTGREVDKCACALASGDNTPKSLCHYCCTKFQEELFEYFIGQKVKIEVTESVLLGGRRCSTAIHIEGR